MIKYPLLFVIVSITGVGLSFAQNDDSTKISIIGIEIIRSHTHGGSPTFVDEAQFILRNPTDKEISFHITETVMVQGMENDSGTVTIQTKKKLKDLKVKFVVKSLSNENDGYYFTEKNWFSHSKEKVPPHSMIMITLNFKSFDAYHSYSDIYKAIQMIVKIDDQTYSSDAVWNIISRNPWK